MQAKRRGREIALLICNFVAEKEWLVNAMSQPLNPHEATHTLHSGGWVSLRASWKRYKNLTLAGVQSTGHPAHSQ
jgi:hypothetical protein